MSNTLSVKVSTRKSGDQNWYEGTVSIAGLKPTKLARRSDGSTQFPTKSALSGAARNLAKALGFSDVDVADPVSASSSSATKSSKKPQIKSAAKKSVASSSTSSPKASSAKKTSKKSTSKKTAAKKSVAATTATSSKKPSTAASKPTQAK